jgi:hypothetical protein
MSRQRGSWVNVTENHSESSTSQHWPPTAAVSTRAVVISSEQSGHFHSVLGTDKIVLSEPAKATSSRQTAPVHSERDQTSGQPNTPRVQNPYRY